MPKDAPAALLRAPPQLNQPRRPEPCDPVNSRRPSAFFPADPDDSLPRSPSASDALDPYYFGLQSPALSPLPPLPPPPDFPASSPDLSPGPDPRTPARDPAAIDRRALVGVGELTSPRWANHDQYDQQPGNFDIDMARNQEPDVPDSPWTIEAVDGELSDHEEVGCPIWPSDALFLITLV